MNKEQSRDFASPDDPVLIAVATALLRAHQETGSANADEWERGVPFRELHRVGASEETLASLVRAGYLQRCERGKSAKPSARSSGAVRFRGSRFLLTARGLSWARRLVDRRTAQSSGTGDEAADLAHVKLPRKPQFDRDRRILWWGGHEVMTFERPAPVQEVIVTTFDDSEWPGRIDSPLTNTRNSKARLRDAVRRLNDAVRIKLIRFRTDGYGRGVRWERYH